ncbi:MAG: M23 family metallopeptidase [Candidatus Rifleibacteriota bacterium]
MKTIRLLMSITFFCFFATFSTMAEIDAAREYDDLEWPCKGVIVQEFGGAHEGIDITNFDKTPLLSMGKGTVTKVFRNSWYGNAVIIKLENYDMELLYAHLFDFQGDNGITRKGQKVEKGYSIGRMGTTGASNGIHLHLEIRLAGKLINPRRILDFIPKASSKDLLSIDLENSDLTDEIAEIFSMYSPGLQKIFLQKLKFSALHNFYKKEEFEEFFRKIEPLIREIQ